MDDRQFLSSRRTAEPSEDRGVVESKDDSLPSLREILARPKQVIDITLDGDNDVTEVSRHSIT
jgi:hypothetical protein